MSARASQQEWDSYFSRAFSTLLSAECCGLRAQLQDRADPKDRALFGEVANFCVTDVSQGAVQVHFLKGPEAAADLNHVLGMEIPPKGLRIISLASTLSISPLDIPSNLAARLFDRYRVRPDFLKALLFFGKVPLESEAKNSYISYHGGEDDEFTVSYKLNFFEKDSKGEWASRQIGVYHYRFPKAQGLGNLFILAAGTQQTKFLSKLEEMLQQSAPRTRNTGGLHLEENTWSFHTALLSCYVDNWRNYFDHLSTIFQDKNDRAIGSENTFMDERAVKEVTALRDLYDRSLFGGAACAGNIDVAQMLAHRLTLPNDERRSLEASVKMLQGLVSSCTVLQEKIKNATDLVGYLITFNYQSMANKLESEVRDVTLRVEKLTDKLHGLADSTNVIAMNTAKDGILISFITVVSAIYVPGSFVASIFGMNFFSFDEKARIAFSADIWIFVILWVSLTLVTGGVFTLFYRKKRSGGGGGGGDSSSMMSGHEMQPHA